MFSRTFLSQNVSFMIHQHENAWLLMRKIEFYSSWWWKHKKITRFHTLWNVTYLKLQQNKLTEAFRILVQSQTLLQASSNPRAMSGNNYCISNLTGNTKFYSVILPLIRFSKTAQIHAYSEWAFKCSQYEQYGNDWWSKSATRNKSLIEVSQNNSTESATDDDTIDSLLVHTFWALRLIV